MKKLIRDYLLQYLMITAGAILAAFALEEFLVPNTVLDGGITGISIILNQLTLQPISIFIIVLNLPFLLLGFQQLGKRFFVSGIYGMVIFTVFWKCLRNFKTRPARSCWRLCSAVYCWASALVWCCAAADVWTARKWLR